MDSESVSVVSAVGVATPQTSEAETFLQVPRRSPLVVEGRVNHLLLSAPQTTQVIHGGPDRLTQPPLIQNIDEIAVISHPKYPIANIHDQPFSFVSPLDYIFPPLLPQLTMVRKFSQSGERSDLTQPIGFHCVQSAEPTPERSNDFRCCHAVVIPDSSGDPTCTGPFDVDISRDWYQRGISTGVPLGQDYRSTLTETTPSFEPSDLSKIPSTRAIVQYQEQRISRDQHQQSQKVVKDPTWSSQRLACMDGAPKAQQEMC